MTSMQQRRHALRVTGTVRFVHVDPAHQPFRIDPPLVNSSNPWATTQADLHALHACPHIGAVSIRTSLWKAFAQSSATHQYTFFSPSLGHATSCINTTFAEGRGEVRVGETSSLNTLVVWTFCIWFGVFASGLEFLQLIWSFGIWFGVFASGSEYWQAVSQGTTAVRGSPDRLPGLRSSEVATPP